MMIEINDVLDQHEGEMEPVYLDCQNFAQMASPSPELLMPPAIVGGISSVDRPASGPIARAVVGGLLLVGGLTTGAWGSPVSDFDFDGADLEIILPAVTGGTPVPTVDPKTERYAELRRKIVESGIPLLDDEELRQEIMLRRGRASLEL